jgi:hypothetical protein
MDQQEKIKQSKKVKLFINIIGRIITLPIVFVFISIAYFKGLFTMCLFYLLYGGELVVYEKTTLTKVGEALQKLTELTNLKE